MRIRSLKPAFWTSEDVAQLEECVALHFAGLWNYCQDNGVGRDDARLIRAALYPLRDAVDTAEVERRQEALVAAGLIARYTDPDGTRLFWVPTWDSHQRVTNPSQSKYARPHIALCEPYHSPMPTLGNGVGNGEGGVGMGTGEKEKSEAADAAAQDEPPMARVMGALRQFGYHPDGTPPADWSDRRDATIAAQMLKRGTPVGELVDAIEGCRLAVDDGAFQDWTPPVKPGDKFTLRLLYHTKSGPLPTWTVAMLALDARWKANGARKPTGPVALGSALGGAVTGLRRGAA